MKGLADSLQENLKVHTGQRVVQKEIIQMIVTRAGRKASIPLLEVETKTC